MVAPERGLLKTEVEIDECFIGGHEPGLKGGRQHGNKALVGVALEVRGRGSGRLRLHVLPDATKDRAGPFATATTEPSAIVHTDGLRSYLTLTELGYDHRPRPQHTGPSRVRRRPGYLAFNLKK